MKLKDRVAIVTGAAYGIGRGIALKLAEEGANVVLADIELEQANKVADEVRAKGVKTLVVKTDVTKSDETERMAQAALKEFGKIDILVNNAGGTARERNAPFYKSKEEVWDYVVAINLKSVRNCTRAVINHMMERRSGKVISIASISGMVGSSNDMVDYSAAKAGIIGFTMALAKEVGSYDINVNAISPGGVGGTRAQQAIPEVFEEYKKTTLIGRIGRPEDIGNMAAFLASDEASFITGQNYAVCGGKSLGF